MKKNDLISAFDEIKPDIYMKERLREKVLAEKPTKNTLLKPAIAIIIATICLVSALNFSKDNNKPIVNESKTTITNKIINSFTIKAYASAGNSVNEPDNKVTISPNGNTILDTQMQRERINRYRDENGIEKIAYDVRYSGEACFLEASGENIKSVTFTSETTTFLYYDSVKRHEMEENGTYYTAVFNISGEYYKNTSKDFLDVFKTLWNNGTLDEYKEKYFKGKSTNLLDYAIGISSLENGEMEIRLVSGEVTNSLQHRDKSITISAPNWNNSVFRLTWHPDAAMKKAAEYPAVPFEELPKDIVTIDVEFENGEIQTKTCEMSFSEDGYLVIKELA